LVAAPSLLAACSSDEEGGDQTSAGKARRGGTVTLASSEFPPDVRVDAQRGIGVEAEQWFWPLLWDTLARDINFEPQPGLAESWESTPDAKKWTFHLRDGVEFHNGKTLTSKDVAFTMTRLLDPKTEAEDYNQFAPFLKPSGIATPDARTIEFSLEVPYAFFPYLMTRRGSSVIPSGTTDFSKGVGTGPFALKSFEAGAKITATRNPNYWMQGRPYLDGVTILAVNEQATAVQSLLAGDIDLTGTLDASLYQQVEQSDATTLLVQEARLWRPLVADTTKEPFNDPRVVQALKHAVDREKIKEVVFGGQAVVSADTPVPPGDAFYPSGLEPFPHDPDQARSLLKEAGHGNGLKLPFFASKVFPGMLETATVFKEAAAESGITIDIQQAPPATYWSDVWLKKPFYVSSWVRGLPAITLPLIFKSDADWNEPRFKSADFDRLIAEAPTLLDEGKQKELYTEALRLINDNSGEIIPVFSHRVLGARKSLQGIKFAGSSVLAYWDGVNIAT